MSASRARIRLCYLANAASVHTQRWATHFARRGFDVHIVSFHHAEIPGISVYRLGAPTGIKPVDYLLAVPRARRLLRRIAPDIVHAHYVTSYGLLGALVGGRPFVITAWGSDVLLAPERSWFHRTLVAHALREADLVTSMAHHMTKRLAELGVRPDRIVTVPFGVDTSIFHPRLRTEAAEDVDIICTRNFEPVYNVELLLEALPRVLAARPALRCVLVGEGSLRRRLESLTVRTGTQRHVTWTGRASQPEVAAWLARAKVFVSPSRSDGNNVSLNEAMACGCFPIASDIPANREWLVEDATGFLVSPDSPELLAGRIIQALNSPELRMAAAERNWEVVKGRADWHKNMEYVEHHYRKL